MTQELRETEVPKELREKIEASMAQYPDRHSAVIDALRAAQDMFGWCSPEALQAVAVVMRVSPAYAESVASFYDMFYLQPVGKKKIMVCTNLSCKMRGADQVLEAFEKACETEVGGSSPDKEIQLEKFECLGGCEMAPMASIDGHYRGPLTEADAETVVDALRRGEKPLPEKEFVGDYGRRRSK